MMRLLFIVGHPAHVHFFRNAIAELQNRGHELIVGAIRKETTTELLDAYGIEYVILGINQPNLMGKLLDLPKKDLHFVRYLHQCAPDRVLSINSPYAAHACAVASVPHLMFCDTEVATVILALTLPFSDAIITPASFRHDFGPRHLRYNGYKELAYLHPNRFRPDPNVLDVLEVGTEERFMVVRFGSWDSSHDLDGRKLQNSPEARMMSIVRSLEAYGRVFVTSERKVPLDLRPYLLEIPIEHIHSVLFYASLYFGEGATMASEAGVLGTPWVFLSPSGRGYLDDQQARYGLGYWERSDDTALRRAEELLSRPNLKRTWAERRTRMLSESIDVTQFIVDLAEHWPRQRTRNGTRMNLERSIAPDVNSTGDERR